MLKSASISHHPTAATPRVVSGTASESTSHAPASASRLSRSYRLVGVVAFSCFLSCFTAGALAQEATSVKDLAKQLYRAVQRDQPTVAIARMNDLAAEGSVKAYRAIIKYGLTGTSYEVERQAGKLLVNADSPEAIHMTLTETGSNSNYRSRIILLAVVSRWAVVESSEGAHGQPTKLNALALQVLLDSTGDRSRPVALTALKWIGEVGRRESIGPLISRLESLEKRGRQDRLYFDIVKVLKNSSGHDFKRAGDWRNWWEVAKNARELPKSPRNPGQERSRKGKSKTVLYKAPPTFFSVPVESDRVLFVIDVSQSMLVRDPELPPDPTELADRRNGSGETAVVQDPGTVDDPPVGALPPSRERLFRVKKELMNVIQALPARTRFGILSFSHELRFWGDGSILLGASASRKPEAVGWVGSLQAYGATRTDQALAQALAVAEVDTIYLLTDGRPRDENNRKIPIEPILQMVKRDNRFKKCRVHTISFRQVKSTEMKQFVKELARQNDGVCTLLR